MLSWIEQVINQLGYLGIVALMALENVFPPLPSEIIMPLAGFTASRGELSLIGVILAGMIGSVLGALPLYGLGRWIGLDRLEGWAERHGKWLLLSRDDLKKVDAWFDRYGYAAVLIGRLVPGVRSLISIPAGFSGMNLGVFLLYTACGTAIWSAALAYAGNLLGEHYHRVDAYLAPVGYVVCGGLVIWLVVHAVRRNRSSRSL